MASSLASAVGTASIHYGCLTVVTLYIFVACSRELFSRALQLLVCQPSSQWLCAALSNRATSKPRAKKTPQRCVY